MIERKVFQCEHCKQFKKHPVIYFSSDRMFRHELNCFYNIKNKTCFSCVHNNRFIKHDPFSESYHPVLSLCGLEIVKHNNTVPMQNCSSWELRDGVTYE